MLLIAQHGAVAQPAPAALDARGVEVAAVRIVGGSSMPPTVRGQVELAARGSLWVVRRGAHIPHTSIVMHPRPFIGGVASVPKSPQLIYPCVRY